MTHGTNSNGKRIFESRFDHLMVLLAAALLTLTGAALLASGCAGDPSSSSSTESDDAKQTALVVYADEGGVLLVDEKTKTPFYPTIPEDNLTNANGDALGIEDLQVGNVVALEGDGIMLESYPGQYPGITSMTVISQGSPEDASDYAELVAQVAAPVDSESVPVGEISYATDAGQITVALDAYSSQWQVGQDGENGSTEQNTVVSDGAFTNESGQILEGTPDLRLGQTESESATVRFDRGFQSIEVNRFPLSDASSQGQSPIVELTAEQQPVEHQVVESDAATLTVQQGFAYTVAATFADGQAHYAFYVTE